MLRLQKLLLPVLSIQGPIVPESPDVKKKERNIKNNQEKKIFSSFIFKCVLKSCVLSVVSFCHNTFKNMFIYNLEIRNNENRLTRKYYLLN